MLNLGFGEIAVILVVALVFIGPKMLPELATNLGKAIREIRKATSDIRQEIELDEAIRKPLQDLRDAATLPPEELKRRDEFLASERKTQEAEKQRIQQEKERQDSIPVPEEPTMVDQPLGIAAHIEKRAQAAQVAKAMGETLAREKPAENPGSIFPPGVISTGGTMILHPPALGQELTPTIEFDTPSPVLTTLPPLHPPPPPPRPPSATSTSHSSPTIAPIVKPSPPTADPTIAEVTQLDPEPTPPKVAKVTKATNPPTTPTPRRPTPRGSSWKKRA